MLRRIRFLTQEQLSKALGVSETTIRNWEKGRAVPRLTIRQVKELCRVLDVSLDQLPDDFGPQLLQPGLKAAELPHDYTASDRELE
ncbi:helix-turn-helix transcriptional regulator [Synechococcus sp. PCC 7336]|uniref:helix-turn-helix transcriptional regulator n=1 Tax=Synechococcus sp. PCC 7336 TaxID=195250 RepID=UPI00034CC71D|nr:helix-turn-helix transcriptional regulator [Synechococcus sp. PCC 7336]